MESTLGREYGSPAPREDMKRHGSAALLLVLALSGCSQSPRRPSVLLISIDTLRADHLSCYGYARPTSPRIDVLASEGVLFESHISSSSWTLPAHTALFTGVSDSVHGNLEALGTALSPRFVTLAEVFRSAGYATAGFYAGPYLHEAFGLSQGFDHYEGCGQGILGLASAEVERWAMDPDVMAASHQGVTNPDVYAASRAWLETHRDEPFFCFVHLWDVHFDFTPPPPYDTLFDPDYDGTITGERFFFNRAARTGKLDERDEQHLIALYDGEIRWTDDTVGDLLDDLADWGIAEDTIVALTSDHGTEFWDHGGIAHRTTLYDELVHVPLVLRYPRALPSGRRVAAQTRLVDVAPTLCELAGLRPPPDGMGHSLVSLARTGALDFDNAALSELFSVDRRLRALRTRDGKLIEDLAEDRRTWFDLARDPGELHGHGELDRGLGADLERAYRARLKELALALESRAGDPEAPELPPGVLESLKAFGYVGGDE